MFKLLSYNTFGKLVDHKYESGGRFIGVWFYTHSDLYSSRDKKK